MANNLKFKFNLTIFDAPWLKKQVETHLFFGFCSRKLPFAIVLVAAFIVDLIYKVVKSGGLVAWSGNVREYFHRQPIDGVFSVGSIIVVIYYGTVLLKLPKYFQAAIGWWIFKPVLALICFILLIVGGLVGFFRGTPDAIYVTLFSLLWIPGIEFINSLTEKQKFITMGRLILSIPILFLWYHTGTWR